MVYRFSSSLTSVLIIYVYSFTTFFSDKTNCKQNLRQTMNIWETTMHSMDVINHNSRNAYIELMVRSSNRVTASGNKEVKIDCSSKIFKVINGQKIYSQEEQYSSKTYTIKQGIYFIELVCLPFNSVFFIFQIYFFVQNSITSSKS